MLYAEKVTYISKPTPEEEAYHKKWNRWPHWMSWSVNMSFPNPETGKMEPGNLPYTMDRSTHEVYMNELEVLKKVDSLNLTPEVRRELLNTIEKYGSAQEAKGREDAEEAWSESDAGPSL